jgi:general secretion pathway protein G
MRTTVRRRAGFTLVELVVVIMIIGILAAIAAPKIFSTSQTANQNAARANLRVIRDALDTYAANNAGQYPAANLLVSGNNAFTQYLRNGIFPSCPLPGITNPTGVSAATGGVGNAPPTDATGNAYVYDQSQGWIIINNSSYASW